MENNESEEEIETKEFENDVSEKKGEILARLKGKVKKYNYVLLPIGIILIVGIIVFLVHALPASLPYADDVAEESVYNHIRKQIERNVGSEFQGFSDEKIKGVEEERIRDYYKNNKEEVEKAKSEVVLKTKNIYRSPKGEMYLNGNDPYYYIRQAQNILKYSTVGTEIRNGTAFDAYRRAPNGSPVEPNLHAYMAAGAYKIASLVSNLSIMQVFAYLGPLLAALSVIPAFFIGRKVGGNVGGYIAAVVITIHPMFVARTALTTSDTDVYAILFPTMIAWIMIEALENKIKWKMVGLSAFAGFLVGVYAFAWAGWWVMMYLIAGTLGILIIYKLVLHIKNKENNSFLKQAKVLAIMLLVFVGVSLIFTVLFIDPFKVKVAIYRPIMFIELGISSPIDIWPNVLISVRELQQATVGKVIEMIGTTGGVLLIMAMIGLLTTIFRRDEEDKQWDIKYLVLFCLWIGVTLWAGTKGQRFILLAVPAVGVGLGAVAGIGGVYIKSFVTQALKLKQVWGICIIVGLSLLFTVYMVQAATQLGEKVLPQMEDSWWNALTKIKENSKPDAIITSWWDFGHIFMVFADRPVTFDGGNQNTPQAHWVGKMLLASNETDAIGILRMLDCGGNNAFDVVNTKINDPYRSVEIVSNVIVRTESDAEQFLTDETKFTVDERKEVLQYTHCTPPEGFIVVTGDMIKKSPPWSYMGGWNFTRLFLANTIKNKLYGEARKELQAELGISEQEAAKTYGEIVKNRMEWVSSRLYYHEKSDQCKLENESAVCKIIEPQLNDVITFDRETGEVNVMHQGKIEQRPQSIIFPHGNQIVRKKQKESNILTSILLVPDEKMYYALRVDQGLAESMFTRMYFYRGHGLRCFDNFYEESQPIAGGWIRVFKVDWNCRSPAVYYQNITKILNSNTSTN